jgi:hypothetical protein
MARGNLLHKDDTQELIRREHRQRLLAMNLDNEFFDSEEEKQSDGQDSQHF